MKPHKHAELIKQEPVAWWDGNPRNAIGISKIKELDDWQPLYTSPQYRELSDDEICEIAVKFVNNFEINPFDLIDFAKAILERAKK